MCRVLRGRRLRGSWGVGAMCRVLKGRRLRASRGVGARHEDTKDTAPGEANVSWTLEPERLGPDRIGVCATSRHVMTPPRRPAPSATSSSKDSPPMGDFTCPKSIRSSAPPTSKSSERPSKRRAMRLSRRKSSPCSSTTFPSRTLKASLLAPTRRPPSRPRKSCR